MGVCEEVRAALLLQPGLNRVRVIVDQGPNGWGFTLLLRDAQTGLPLDLPFGSTVAQPEDRRWSITGPWPTSGMDNSLEGSDTRTPAPISRVSPFDRYRSGVTDFAVLMGWETRVIAGPLTEVTTLELGAGEWAVLDFGRVFAGFPEFTIAASSGEDAVVDVSYAQTLPADRRIRYSNSGRMKHADRVLVPGTGERYRWRSWGRRALRTLHLSCRSGKVRLSGISLRSVGYPVGEPAQFSCSDPLLNRIHQAGLHTLTLLMQHGYQDCLKREQGTLNTSSFNYASRAALLSFGDTALARKNLLQAIETQNETGWFDSHGVSSPNSDEPTQCLWWIIWLRDFYHHTGDAALVTEVWDRLENALRYFARGINRHFLLEGRNRPLAWRGQWVYVDDSTNSGVYDGLFDGELLGYNILWAAALFAAAELAAPAGFPLREPYWKARAERARASLQERFWDEKVGRFRDWRDGEREAETYHPIFQIAALYFRLCENYPERAERLLDYLENDLGLPSSENKDYPLFTFGFYFYYLDVLFRYGRDALAVELMRRVHGTWLEAGATAFGEFVPLSEIARTHFQTGDVFEFEVHAYGMSAHPHLYAHILGVTPLLPGYAAIRVAPQPGGLTQAAGRIYTPRGIIAIAWTQEQGRLTIQVDAPPGVTVELPP